VLQSLKILFRSNLFFYIPFVVWVIVGLALQLQFTTDELFFAVNRSHTPFLDKLNTVFSAYGRGDIIPIILVSLLLIPAYRNRNYILTTLIFGALIPVLIFLIKLYFNAPRPLSIYGEEHVHTVPWLDNLFYTSFPSGHTIGAFGFFYLLSVYLPKSYKPLSLLFFLLALACGYSRLYLGQHFFLDVYAGSIIGVVCTTIIYWLGIYHIKPLPVHHHHE
jgi:membrane-associated phospholipid phosphatase